MSYQDYANIIAGYNSKVANRREASESRIRTFNDLYSQRGLSSMEKLQNVANEKYNALLEKAQQTALDNLNITEQDRAKVESIVGLAGVSAPVLNRVVGKPVDSLLKKLAQAKKTPAPNLERISNYAKPKLEIVKGLGDDMVGDDEFGTAGDLVGQEAVPTLDQAPIQRTEDQVKSAIRELSEKQKGKLPMKARSVELEDLNRPRSTATFGEAGPSSATPRPIPQELQSDEFGASDLLGQEPIVDTPTPSSVPTYSAPQPTQAKTFGGDMEMRELGKSRPVKTRPRVETTDEFEGADDLLGQQPIADLPEPVATPTPRPLPTTSARGIGGDIELRPMGASAPTPTPTPTPTPAPPPQPSAPAPAQASTSSMRGGGDIELKDIGTPRPSPARPPPLQEDIPINPEQRVQNIPDPAASRIPTRNIAPQPEVEPPSRITPGIAGEAGEAAEGAEGIAAAVGEAEAATAPLDVIPGVGEIAAIGAGVFGLGEALGWWGGGHKEAPVPTQPHIAPTYTTSGTSVTPTYRSFQRSYVAPNINTGIMR